MGSSFISSIVFGPLLMNILFSEVPTIECPPQTPKKSPRKRPIKSYAERWVVSSLAPRTFAHHRILSDDSDFAPNPSPYVVFSSLSVSHI